MLCQKETRMGKSIQDMVYVDHNLPAMVHESDTQY